MSDAVVLRTRGLHAGYGGLRVVRDVGLHVERGEVVALLGPNGAGKTTTLLTLAGVLPVLAGQVEVLGRPLRRTAPHLLARRGLALVPEDRGLFAQLTVAENLRLAARGRRVERADAVLAAFPALPPLWRRRVALLSGGEQQMVALAGALLRRPRLVLIDELSLGLAPRLVLELLAIVRRLADQDGAGVLIVEQHAQLVLDVADRAVVLRHGEVVLSGSVAEVRAGSDTLESSYLGEAAGPDRPAARLAPAQERNPA